MGQWIPSRIGGRTQKILNGPVVKIMRQVKDVYERNINQLSLVNDEGSDSTIQYVSPPPTDPSNSHICHFADLVLYDLTQLQYRKPYIKWGFATVYYPYTNISFQKASAFSRPPSLQIYISPIKSGGPGRSFQYWVGQNGI